MSINLINLNEINSRTVEVRRQFFYLAVSEDSKKSDLYEPPKKFDFTKSNEEQMLAMNKATLDEISAKYG